FCGFLRGEAKFDSVEALIVQMDADCARARAMLADQSEALSVLADLCRY
ncbi:MAG: bifunctional riboflavin kinase/FAD synthetase, partial [Hyphomicrobiales bacterium]|nr:bifunctional riboflavin kinase/FAD synthetase [Hyphomicrobiales bacterium]